MRISGLISSVLQYSISFSPFWCRSLTNLHLIPMDLLLAVVLSPFTALHDLVNPLSCLALQLSCNVRTIGIATGEIQGLSPPVMLEPTCPSLPHWQQAAAVSLTSQSPEGEETSSSSCGTDCLGGLPLSLSLGSCVGWGQARSLCLEAYVYCCRALHLDP